MSRWIEVFEGASIAKARDRLKVATAAINVPKDSSSALSELSRLTKLIAYLDSALSTIDPEIIGLNAWDEFRQGLETAASYVEAYETNPDVANLFHANSHIDVSVARIVPYLLARGEVGAALQKAAISNAKAVEKIAADIISKGGVAVADIESSRDDALNSARRLSEIVRTAEASSLSLAGEDGAGGVFADVEKKAKAVVQFYNELLSSDSGESSIKDQVNQAKEKVLSDRDAVGKLYSRVEISTQEIEKFETKIYGVVDDSGVRKGGLTADFDAHISEMNGFEQQQKIKYGALIEQIESLLPGAASAGLASAYKDMKDSFNAPIQAASKLFYLSIGILVFVSFAVSIEGLSFEGVKFYAVNNWTGVLQELARKLPYYAPVLWLAFYASKRRSEYQRLQQEYAHKEALAKSFDSYKKQVTELGTDSNELLKVLIGKAVDAVAYNASSTLDGKHGDEMPLQRAVEKVADVVKDIQKLAGAGKP